MIRELAPTKIFFSIFEVGSCFYVKIFCRPIKKYLHINLLLLSINRLQEYLSSFLSYCDWFSIRRARPKIQVC